MNLHFDVAEVARSIEFFNLGRKLQEEARAGNNILEHIREPYLRKRRDVGSVVVAFGSYDPLSRAHEALFLRGLNIATQQPEGTDLDELLIVTSTTHFEKHLDLKRNSTIYDRIHSLEGFASCHGRISLALFNNPYFIHLAESIKQEYSPGVNIYFVVGSDVMEKVVDEQAYTSRGMPFLSTIEQLFRNRFIVSDRKIQTPDGEQVVGLDSLKQRYPVLAQHSAQMISINLQDTYEGLEIPIEEVSSTLIRTRRSQGAETRSLEAVGISDFIDKRGLYLRGNELYVVFTYARERFAIENEGRPIASYIDRLMDHLHRLSTDDQLRRAEIELYANRVQA